MKGMGDMKMKFAGDAPGRQPAGGDADGAASQLQRHADEPDHALGQAGPLHQQDHGVLRRRGRGHDRRRHLDRDGPGVQLLVRAGGRRPHRRSSCPIPRAATGSRASPRPRSATDGTRRCACVSPRDRRQGAAVAVVAILRCILRPGRRGRRCARTRRDLDRGRCTAPRRRP